MMKETLFNNPKNKYINSNLIDGKTVKRLASNFKYRLSVYGILIENEQLLLQKNPTIDSLCIPGGGVEIDEMMKEALVREFEEETGIIVNVEEQIGTIEDFFTLKDEDAHTVLVFYYVTRIKQSNRSKLELTDDSEYTQFVDIAELQNINIQRVFRKFLDEFPIE